MSIEELKNKHLVNIKLLDDQNDIEIGNGLSSQVILNTSKEATNITLSFCIDVLKSLKPNCLYDKSQYDCKIQELEKLIEKGV